MLLAYFLVGGLTITAVAGDYASEALSAHNKYRRIHNASPLRLNSQMSSSAASYARKLASMGYLKHSARNSPGRNGDGENLVYRCSSYDDPLPASQAVKILYDEVCEYNFNRQGFAMSTGHFTQLVWKGSQELGVGTARKRKGRMNCLFVVFRYKDTGNMRGRFESNVSKGSFRESYCSTLVKKDQPEENLEE